MTDPDALVIGGGPAGLMAATEIARAGYRVIVAEAKPSLGRKLLMAGKSGLNLTRAEPIERFMEHYAKAAPWLAPMIAGFGPDQVQLWAQSLGQPVFTGSTGRVFPQAMKASPLLRAWLRDLDAAGVDFRLRWRWEGWDGDSSRFATPDGPLRVTARATVLALGGASWARLGSDGAWVPHLRAVGTDPAPFAPANAALSVAWSDHMARHLGQPVKSVAFRAGPLRSRGEAVIAARGLEGGGIYAISRAVREGHAPEIDLRPDLDTAEIAQRLAQPRGGASLSNHLRKRLRLGPAHVALLQEFGRPLPDDPAALARIIKALPVRHKGLAPMDAAISTAGGLRLADLDDDLMLRARPGVFAAGEMLDWEAPTGGYLLTACLATGRWAGLAAARYLARA